MPNITQINQFITGVAVPFLSKLAAALPGLVTTVEADFQASVQAITKLVEDFVAGLTSLGKSS